MGDIFLQHFGFLVTSERRSNTAGHLSFVPEHLFLFMTAVFRLLMTASNTIACRVAKLQSPQSGFINMTMYSNGLHLNPIEHLWDPAQPESRIASAQKSAGSPWSYHVRVCWCLTGAFFLFFFQACWIFATNTCDIREGKIGEASHSLTQESPVQSESKSDFIW